MRQEAEEGTRWKNAHEPLRVAVIATARARLLTPGWPEPVQRAASCARMPSSWAQKCHATEGSRPGTVGTCLRKYYHPPSSAWQEAMVLMARRRVLFTVIRLMAEGERGRRTRSGKSFAVRCVAPGNLLVENIPELLLRAEPQQWTRLTGVPNFF